MAKKGLGRGLEHLFEQSQDIIEQDQENNNFIEVDIDDIKPNPYQPRKTFNEEKLNELAISIQENGVFQPILLRKGIIGYEIISGERRYRASKIAKLNTIPAIIYDYNDQQMMEVALIENIQRDDLNIVEEAESYVKLMQELGYKQEELAQRIGKSRSHISNITRILQLNKNTLSALENNQISLGHAKILVSLKDEIDQDKLVQKIIKENITVRELEKIIKSNNNNETEQNNKKDKKSEYARLEKIMEDKLGSKIQITGKGKGTIKIEYLSDDDLERLLEILNIL